MKDWSDPEAFSNLSSRDRGIICRKWGEEEKGGGEKSASLGDLESCEAVVVDEGGA